MLTYNLTKSKKKKNSTLSVKKIILSFLKISGQSDKKNCLGSNGLSQDKPNMVEFFGVSGIFGLG